MTDYGENFVQNAPFLIKELGSMFKGLPASGGAVGDQGSEVDPSFNYPYEINGIWKKRGPINPER